MFNRRTHKIDFSTRLLVESEGKKTFGPGELETGILYRCWSCSQLKSAVSYHPAAGQEICKSCVPAFEERIA